MLSTKFLWPVAAPLCCAFISTAVAEVKITAERTRRDDTFKFETVPPPALDDAATGAEFNLCAWQFEFCFPSAPHRPPPFRPGL